MTSALADTSVLGYTPVHGQNSERTPRSALYQRDYYGWALEQAAHLRAGRFAALDLENLAEEIEDLAKAEARELRSRYATLVTHLLKWEIQPQRRSHSWVATIVRERDSISDHLDEARASGLGMTSCSRGPTRRRTLGQPPKATCPLEIFGVLPLYPRPSDG